MRREIGLGREAYEVQNPAICAVILWRFVVAYSSAQESRNPCPLILAFVPIPLVLSQEISDVIAGTQLRSGMRAFSAKFTKTSSDSTDILLSLHDRVRGGRELSLSAMHLARACQLIDIDTRAASVYPLSSADMKGLAPNSISSLLRAAEKLGGWCATLSLHEISQALRIQF
jgi:hypothetical protein